MLISPGPRGRFRAFDDRGKNDDCVFGEGTRVNTSFLLSSLALDDVITGDGVCGHHVWPARRWLWFCCLGNGSILRERAGGVTEGGGVGLQLFS